MDAIACKHVERVVIGLCTCRRPQMLWRCLISLGKQSVDASIDPTIVVIDNEESPNNQRIVEAFERLSPFPVFYWHEPRRGIAVARNAILDVAVELGADWIAMLDDDEIAEPGWLAALMADEYRDVPVLQGRNEFIYPDNMPF